MTERAPDSDRYSRPHKGKTPEELGLTPIESYDLRNVVTVRDMAYELTKTPMGGGELGRGSELFCEMVSDPDTFVVMTVAGAMTPAKMGLIITEAVDQGWVQAVVSTGALMAHGYVEAAGMKHYLAPKGVSDTDLYEMRMNRIYTALEPEDNLDDVEKIFNKVIDGIDENRTLSSRLITSELGRYLVENVEGRGILKSAYEKGVPVFVPAFSDSELGLDLGLYNRLQKTNGKEPRRYDPMIDLDFYAELIKLQEGKKLGIFTVGGGVPRNWAQQIGPYIDLQEKRKKTEDPSYIEKDPVMFAYGIRICPEPVDWGGLSGCTYEEGKSWGKFFPDAKTSEILMDATFGLPFVAQTAYLKFEDKPRIKNIHSGNEALNTAELKVRETYPNS